MIRLWTRNLFGRHFDAEVAASDHDGVGRNNDRFELVDGRGFSAWP